MVAKQCDTNNFDFKFLFRASNHMVSPITQFHKCCDKEKGYISICKSFLFKILILFSWSIIRSFVATDIIIKITKLKKKKTFILPLLHAS